MTDHGETIRALSKITDAGLFERLATAVLRTGAPALYSNLTHPGMNADGKTVKSPVDGIAFVARAVPPHMVIAHHASGASDDLRKKWLHDPSTVRPSKGRKPTAPPGDVLKTMGIVEEERKRTPGLLVTLALTTNREPPEELTRDIEAAAKGYGVSIDIWSCSRIADFLDNDPDGEWLRNNFLGLVQQRLSKQLLRDLSRSSIEANRPAAQLESLVSRELDRVVAERSPRPVAFLVGESGSGKTIACYKHLKAHIDAGGCGLVLMNETLAAHRTFDQAVDAELRKIHPKLEADAGARVRAICSPEDPFLVVVEDVNWSENPALLLERLVGWAGVRPESVSTERLNWGLFCPVWPKTLVTISDEARKRIESLSISAAPFTANEARTAIECNAALVNVPVSSLEADNLAEALGNDPLLVALYDFVKKPEPPQVIGNFINARLRSLASSASDFTLTEYRTTLKALARGILTYRRVDPNWVEIRGWFSNQPDRLAALRQIVKRGEVVRLIETGNVERLAFRHDRVRAWLLSDVLAASMQSGELEDVILTEPFFADVIGAALAAPDISADMAKRVMESNPLALFHALKAFREPSADIHHAVLRAIETWLDTAGTHDRANRALRWAALHALSETESSHVLAITDRFSDETWATLQARFRNGDLKAGIRLCSRLEPGVTAPWHDHQIAHAKVRFGKTLIRMLDDLLNQSDLSGRARTGALRLAGHFAEPSLADAIAACWASDPDRTERLAGYLWAAAECCGNKSDRLLGPVCDAWAALPDKGVKEGSSSPRNALAADHISWAFKKSLPESSLHYFIERAKQKELHWPITCMLRGIDHPDAVEFIAREFAARSREFEGKEDYWFFPISVRSDWERRQREEGARMSLDSRRRLKELWEDIDHDKYLRRQAFLLWATTSAPDDISLLRTVEVPASLADDILFARLKRGDRAAIPAMLEKLKTDKRGFWWQLGRYIWSDDLTNALDEAFQRRSTKVDTAWGIQYETDPSTSEFVMRLKPATGEKLLVKHWQHLRYSSYFVQAALYLATPISCALAQEAMSKCPDAKEMLKYCDMHFGIKMSGHPGVSRIEQVEALVPYLDYLDDSAIHAFWELCNDRGWLEFRQTHLDGRLTGQWREVEYLDDSGIVSHWDTLLTKDDIYWIGHWIDRYFNQGGQVGRIFQLFGSWLREHRTIAALELAAAAIVHAGRRCDLDILHVGGIEPIDKAEAIITDARFAISRRSLV
jgi:hypothetical protein